MQRLIVHGLNKKHEILSPSNWRELSLQQLIEIENDWRPDPTVLKAFSILTGLSLEITENLKDDDIEAKVWSVINFLNKPPKWDELPPPRALTINKKLYTVPTKIGSLMLGQKLMIQQAANDVNEIIKQLPQIVAIIMQPYVDKIRHKGKLKYSSERVEIIAKQLTDENGLECYALALFFFLKLRNIQSIKMTGLTTYQRQKSQTKTLSKTWLKPSG